MVYISRKEKIVPAFYGTVSISIVIASVVAIFFLNGKEINLNYKMLLYTIFLELIVIWIESIFINFLYNYKKVSYSFIKGIFIGILLMVLYFY